MYFSTEERGILFTFQAAFPNSSVTNIQISIPQIFSKGHDNWGIWGIVHTSGSVLGLGSLGYNTVCGKQTFAFHLMPINSCLNMDDPNMPPFLLLFLLGFTISVHRKDYFVCVC